jgi:hypothetical protein
MAIWNNNGSRQTCNRTEWERCFNGWKQGLGILLSLVDTLNNNNVIEHIDASTSPCYSELRPGWITNTTSSLRRNAEAILKGRVPFLGTPHALTLSILSKVLNNTTTPWPHPTQIITHDKYYVKFSPRVTHGAHTVNFTHVGQGDSGRSQ